MDLNLDRQKNDDVFEKFLLESTCSESEGVRIISIPKPIRYWEAMEVQRKLHAERVADSIPDTFLFLEHEPVITRGRGLQQRPGEKKIDNSLDLLSQGFREIDGIPVIDIERGGGLTYHGPGQLVIYPICKLGPGGQWVGRQDLGFFLRRLENVVVSWLNDYYGEIFQAFTKENESGVWVASSQNDNSKQWSKTLKEKSILSRHHCETEIILYLNKKFNGETHLQGCASSKKIASMGIAVRKWVTFHGIAINLTNDLSPFRKFNPCGYSPDVMTRLQDWVLP